MSKHRKHRDVPPERRDATSDPVRAPATVPRRSAPPVLLQLVAIVGLSTVLGITFNSASPVGVRFNQPTSPPSVSPPIVTEEKAPAPIPKTANATTATQPTNIVVVAPPPRPASRPVVLPPPPTVPPAPVPPPHSHTTNPVVAAARPPGPAQLNPAPIHWPETKALVAAGRAVLVDVRHRALFEAGHIPGAISLPEMSSPDEFKAFLARQPADMTVIVYCSSTSCSQSGRVAARLVNEFHWPAVQYMTGGYAEYQQAELAKPAPQPGPPAP